MVGRGFYPWVGSPFLCYTGCKSEEVCVLFSPLLLSGIWVDSNLLLVLYQRSNTTLKFPKGGIAGS